MTNTSYLNLFPVRPRRRPSNVQRAAATTGEQNKQDSSDSSPFSERRVDRAFELMGKWHSAASADRSLALASLKH